MPRFSAAEFAGRLLLQARRVIPSGASWSAASSGREGGGGEPQDFVARLRSEVAQAVLPVQNLPSVMKRRADVAGEVKVAEGPSDLVISVRTAVPSRDPGCQFPVSE